MFVCRMRRAALVLAATAGALLSGGAAAHAAGDPLGGFNFAQGQFVVEENAGQATISVTRPVTEASFPAQIRYITLGNGYDPQEHGPFQCGDAPCSAVSGTDFTSVKGMLSFSALQTSASFTVPIANHGNDTVPKTIRLALFGPSGRDRLTGSTIGVGDQSNASLTILNDIPAAPRNPANPLELPVTPTAGNPLAGARFFVDPNSPPAKAAQQPGFSGLLAIAMQPGTARFGDFSYTSPYVHDIGTAVSRYLAYATTTEPGTVPLLATYRIVDGHCGHYTPPSSSVDAYENFVRGFSAGIGSYPAVLFLEEDALITSPCLTAQGVKVRMAELAFAISTFAAQNPHLVVYLDAGAADALPAARAAALLRMADVRQAQGFFLNSTHFDWTLNEIRYGQQIARMTGGKHFVVNTGENGQGPLIPRDRVHQGNEVLCNPPGRGLGPKPSAHTGYAYADAFEWTSNPGESGGPCVPGAPATGAYWPAYGLGLVSRADYRVRGSSPTPRRSRRPSSRRAGRRRGHRRARRARR